MKAQEVRTKQKMHSTTISFCIWVMITLNLIRGQEFDTTNGRVKGKQITILGKQVDVFHGIPFAKPPIGDLRFKHPQPADPWRPEVKDATLEKPSCIQPTYLNDIMNFDELARPPYDFSEDCLYLSIWKPSSAHSGSNLAVMVWIYGGGFMIGSTRIPGYNGQYLAAENDVIVVSANYRIGPFGFSYLGPDTIPGNMGLMDQIETMKWVQNNIKNFGGDGNQVTLFGESAGAMSIGYHLASPLARDLFNNAILQSGSPVHSLHNAAVFTATEARNSMKSFTEVVDCSRSSDADVYECLKTTDSKKIDDVFTQLFQQQISLLPVQDGYYLPNMPLTVIQRGEQKKTNILLGVTKDEGTLLTGLFLNTEDGTLRSTGEKFGYQHLNLAMTGVNDMEQKAALNFFYVSEQSRPVDYLQVLNDMMGDVMFKCPALQLGSLYSKSNDVYLYSLDHRSSTIKYPEWMGVPHGFDIEYVFGHPLNESRSCTQNEKKLTKQIMTYWSNFAKTGNPNSPVPVIAPWPVFNKEKQTYMSLDVDSNLATRDGFRRHQCAFVNEKLPMVLEEANKHKSGTPSSNSEDSEESCHSDKQDDDSCSSRDSP